MALCFFLEMAAMFRVELIPDVQVVPPDTAIIADQVPLAQRWNEVPAMQFH
jgi:hypothetical protein